MKLLKVSGPFMLVQQKFLGNSLPTLTLIPGLVAIYKYLPSSLYREKEKWTRRNFEYRYVHHISNFFLLWFVSPSLQDHSRDKNEKAKTGLKLSGATTQLFHSFLIWKIIAYIIHLLLLSPAQKKIIIIRKSLSRFNYTLVGYFLELKSPFN